MYSAKSSTVATIGAMSTVQDVPTTRPERSPYVWDYNITAEQFRQMLDGTFELGRLNRDWAVVRLIEYAPYDELIRQIGYRGLVEGWPRWRPRVRAHDQRRALDFVVNWVLTYHPELLDDERDRRAVEH